MFPKVQAMKLIPPQEKRSSKRLKCKHHQRHINATVDWFGDLTC